jgi:diguanylate cyclase (GGDEF)-like protein
MQKERVPSLPNPAAREAFLPSTLEIENIVAGETPARGNPRILIVDDVEDNRAILARRFQMHKFDTVEADGGLRALELIKTQSFDAVLLDIMMPDLNGLEVLRRLRCVYSSETLPVIMVTADSLNTTIVEALRIGANDYIVKPVDFPIAKLRLQGHVDRKRNRDSLLAANRRLTDEIASRKYYEAKAQYLAFHDSLTGLSNRRLFQENLQLSLQTNSTESLGVLFVDLDGFKKINDTHGHSVGDALLKSIAERMLENLGDAVHIARLDGDEFAIIQTAGDQPNAALALAKHALQLISAPFRISDRLVVSVSASIGVAVHSGETRDIEPILRAADLAMYRAKESGGGACRVYEPGMEAEEQAALRLILDMQKALLENDFEVHYQPIVCAATQAITGFEALARWNHAERGWISPAEFIPVAERTGMIAQLGEWVLRRACADAAALPFDIKVAVNLSPSQFENGNLVATVFSALSSSGLSPKRLELEITESVLLDRNDRNLTILRQLQESGVRISLDDFGTGYSSLSYLHSFAFDKIKIDQSFIRNLIEDDRSDTIVSAIIGLGVSFGMTTNAEGVETAEQMARLAAKGCAELQGYLFSKPVAREDLLTLIGRINKRKIA